MTYTFLCCPVYLVLTHLLFWSGSLARPYDPPTLRVIIDNVLNQEVNSDHEYVLKKGGKNLQLKCHYPSQVKEEQKMWLKDGQEIVSFNQPPKTSNPVKIPGNSHVTTDTIILYTLDRGKDDVRSDGIYSCQYENISSSVFTLKLAFMKNGFKHKPSSLYNVSIGERIQLDCVPAKSYPPARIYWISTISKKNYTREHLSSKCKAFNYKHLKDSQTTYCFRGNSLMLMNIQKDANDVIQCVADNGFEKQTVNSTVYVNENGPRFTIRPQDKLVQVGNTVTFDCLATSENFDRIPVIKWSKQQDRYTKLRWEPSGSSIKINDVQVNDSGVYVCTATLDNIKITDHAKLTVSTTNSLLMLPQHKNVVEGSTVRLLCRPKDKACNIIHWYDYKRTVRMYKNDSNGDYDNVVVLQDNSLIIREIKISDGGSYQCVCTYHGIKPSATKETIKANVEVRMFTPTVPPIIERGGANLTLSTGGIAIIYCKALYMSDRPLHTSWSKDGRSIGSTDRVHITEHYLNISGLRVSDTGVYVCKTTVSHSDTLWVVSLKVLKNGALSRTPEDEKLPGKPRGLAVDDFGTNWVKLRWSSPVDPQTVVLGYRIEYYSPDLELKWKSIERTRDHKELHTVSGLELDATYIFLVKCRNQFGYSNPSDLSEPVVTMDTPDWHQPVDTKHLSYKDALARCDVQPRMSAAINSTAIRVNWRVIRYHLYIDQYRVDYWIAGEPEESKRQIIVRDRLVHSVALGNLGKFYTYNVMVTAMHVGIDPVSSPALLPWTVTTKQDVPTDAPHNVVTYINNEGEIHVEWTPPDSDKLNGILAGYAIWIKSDNYSRNLTRISNTTMSLTIPGDWLLETYYELAISAFTGAAGYGPEHRVHIPREVVLAASLFFKEPWFICSVGFVVWIVLLLVSIYVYCHHRRKKCKSHGNRYISPDTDYELARMGAEVSPCLPQQSMSTWGNLSSLKGKRAGPDLLRVQLPPYSYQQYTSSSSPSEKSHFTNGFCQEYAEIDNHLTHKDPSFLRNVTGPYASANVVRQNTYGEPEKTPLSKADSPMYQTLEEDIRLRPVCNIADFLPPPPIDEPPCGPARIPRMGVMAARKREYSPSEKRVSDSSQSLRQQTVTTPTPGQRYLTSSMTVNPISDELHQNSPSSAPRNLNGEPDAPAGGDISDELPPPDFFDDRSGSMVASWASGSSQESIQNFGLAPGEMSPPVTSGVIF
uniref:Robo protein n=1 Tax=Meara stichopi TaxID=84115 RepID=A0A2P1DVB8_9BILA|nr:Robo protein [Meara stichopi]